MDYAIVTRQGLASDLHEHIAGVEKVRLALREVQGDRLEADEWVMGCAYAYLELARRALVEAAGWLDD